MWKKRPLKKSVENPCRLSTSDVNESSLATTRFFLVFHKIFLYCYFYKNKPFYSF